MKKVISAVLTALWSWAWVCLFWQSNAQQDCGR